jgi:phage terminase large subunit-like protein
LLAAAEAEVLWRQTRLPHQIEPEGDHFGWAMISGRGAGKSHTGGNWARRQAFTQPGSVGAVVAPTYRDLRNTVFPALFRAIPAELYEFTQTNAEMKLANGSTILGFTGQEPDRVRGANLSWAWCDELAFWQYVDDTWSNLLMALRVGDPRVFVSTTPRNVELLKSFLDDPAWVVTRATTYDNPHLSGAAVGQMDAIYGGTSLGRQELLGEFIDEIPGALWTRALLERAADAPQTPAMQRIVVGVDPAGGRGETGIVVCGVDSMKRGWVLADLSGAGSPDEWARRVVEAYHGWKADRVVVERNFGGDMAEHTIRTVDRNVPIKTVVASRGKVPRAEPVAALYEQGRVFHAVRSPKLEDQMCTYTEEDKTSPDRLDAMVWALSELMVTGRTVPNVAPVAMGKGSYWRQ